MTRWLNRQIAAEGPYLALAISQREFDKVLKHCGVSISGPWISAGAYATAHFFSRKNKLIAVVCIDATEKHSGIEIAGILVHEAVHVWQEYCDDIGEESPGREQEAYAIQAIAQGLMAEFARRTQPTEAA